MKYDAVDADDDKHDLVNQELCSGIRFEFGAPIYRPR